ncbi:hypothetical protein N7488_011041 [Penicillium malachiteum]|nr:hypothetical protein N7488_011041 [Penicillium malachiteum]
MTLQARHQPIFTIIPPETLFNIPADQNDPSKVQLSRIAHVYFDHHDLEAFAKFAKDFGFVEAEQKGKTIYFRGYGKDPYIYVACQSSKSKSQFKGAAFIAKDRENFEKAAKLPGAICKTLDEAPGGGEMTNGTFLHVIYGQAEREIRKGQFQRYHEGPALIHKLGHYSYVCKEFQTELEFYTGNFNFVHSDILYLTQFPDRDVMTFMHLDLGEEYTDHHTLFLQHASPAARETYFHHTSFEVEDFDTQLTGHRYLAKKGWTSVWGIGRHILLKIEHYADGDVVNQDNQTTREAVGPLSVWGPELPKDFGDNKAT